MEMLLISIAKTLFLTAILILLTVDVTITYKKLKCEEELIKKIDGKIIDMEDAIREAYDIISN